VLASSLTRLDAVRQQFGAQSLDALLLTDKTNIGYLSGFTGSSAFVLITPDEALLMTDGRYTIRARQECPQFTILEASGSGGYPEKLAETLTARSGIHRLGFEAGKVTVTQWQQFQKENRSNLEWVGTEKLVEGLRVVKDATEIAAMRNAIAIAESAFETIKPLLRPGLQEREAALELEFAVRRDGADDRAFETIVASGAQGAHPHHRPNERPFVTGDLVTIDWGAYAGGYNSDITRTVAIGSVSSKQRDTYDLVLEAQRRAIAAIRPGRTGQEIDAVARDFFRSHDCAQFFSHGLGHSLGREVHDGPGLSPRSEKFVIQPGMVLTVEPGIYIENWGGIRIEEDVLVTDDGCEILTHLPNGLEVLG
jgi:Xaa-Pro aminopeptidase